MVENDLKSTVQTVDVEVSKKKFEDELAIFLNRQDAHRENGIILLKAAFPNVELLFIAKQLIPAPVVFSVRINYTNYDLEPLSVSFIDPFTGNLAKANQMLINFNKKNGAVINGNIMVQALLQSETLDGFPFLCIPGVREYHNHPFHTGDSWLLHRKSGGEGSLGYLIDKLFDYGISAISSFNLPISTPMIQLGFDPNKIPE